MPKSRGILLPNGENHSKTPVQLARLLQQGLAEVIPHDHMLITHPNLGYVFYLLFWWLTEIETLVQYIIIANLCAWLETHFGFTNPAAAVCLSTTSIIALGFYHQMK